MKNRFFFIFLVLFCFAAHCQHDKTCGTDYYHSVMMYESQYKSAYNHCENKFLTIPRKNIFNEVYTIPVVFHLICRPGSSPGDFFSGNPDDHTVTNIFLANLNHAFRNSGDFNQGVGTDVEIEFCLATKDPNGNSTGGITRFETPLSDSCGLMVNSHYTDSVKMLTSWNPEKYLNIWIVADLVDASGFATYPWFPRDHRDGVIIDILYLSNDYMAGVMLAHEIGHYLGLYHVFYGGCPNDDCLIQGDRVCDTPPSTQSSFILSCIDNTCTTDADDTTANNPFNYDVDDNLRTYMNYGYPSCINQFTYGQAERMRLMLVYYRSELLSSDGCENINLTHFYKNPHSAFFNYDHENMEIRITHNCVSDIQVTVYDCMGKIVVYKESNNKNSILLSTSSLNNGLYFVKIESIYGNMILADKVIIY